MKDLNDPDDAEDMRQSTIGFDEELKAKNKLGVPFPDDEEEEQPDEDREPILPWSELD